MTTVPRFAAASLLALSGLVGLAETEALACSPMQEPSGYAAGLAITSVVYEDQTSGQACIGRETSCGTTTWYTGVLRGLRVVPTLTDAPSAGQEDSYVTRGGAGVRYALKDAAGTVVEEITGSANGVTFSRLGATVCIDTRRVDADAGTPTDVVAEVCAPITVTSLEVTEQDRAQHAADLAAACGQDDAGTGDGGTTDGGTTDGDRTSASSDGCSLYGTTRGTSSSMLWAFGLVLGAGLIRRRTAAKG